MCDLAEDELLRRAGADDALRLLAMLAEAEDYETPAERVADLLEEERLPAVRRSRDPERRAAEVTAFLLAAGGEG